MSEWIKCTTLLPPESETVLLVYNGEVCTGKRVIPYAMFNNFRWEWQIDGEDEPKIDQGVVTHWQTLPEVPLSSYEYE